MISKTVTPLSVVTKPHEPPWKHYLTSPETIVFVRSSSMLPKDKVWKYEVFKQEPMNRSALGLLCIAEALRTLSLERKLPNLPLIHLYYRPCGFYLMAFGVS